MRFEKINFKAENLNNEVLSEKHTKHYIYKNAQGFRVKIFELISCS